MLFGINCNGVEFNERFGSGEKEGGMRGWRMSRPVFILYALYFFLCLISQYSVLHTNLSIPVDHFSNLSKNLLNLSYAVNSRKFALLLVEVRYRKGLV